MTRIVRLRRRTLLQGLGATIALPFLEEMLPGRAQAMDEPERRVITATLGGGLAKEWQAGAYFDGVLAPLAPFADRLCFVRGLQGRSSHGPANALLMTGADWIKDVPVTTAPTIDWRLMKQAYPERFPGPIPFLNFGVKIRNAEYVLNEARVWDDGPNPIGFPHYTPNALFQAIFGRLPSQSVEDAMGEAQADASILDAVLDQYHFYTGDGAGLSMASRTRISDHADHIRSLESAIGGLDLMGCDAPELPADVIPGAIEDAFPGGGANAAERADVSHVIRQFNVMADLFVLAMRCDLSRFGHAVIFPLAAHGSWRGRFTSTGGAMVDYDALRANVEDLNRHGDWHNTNHLLPRHSGEALERAFSLAEAYRQPGIDMLAHLLDGLDAPESIEANGATILENSIFVAASELATNHSGDGVFHVLGPANGTFRSGLVDVAPDATSRQLYDTVLGAFDAPLIDPEVAVGEAGSIPEVLA